MRVYMPLPFDAGVVASAQGPEANPGNGNSHFDGSWLQWAWDFSTITQVKALTAGTVVAYNDSYADSENPEFDHGVGNYITIAYRITDNFSLYQTFAHLRQGSVSGAGIGLGPAFQVDAGDILGFSSGSGGYMDAQHVHVHFGTSLIAGTPTSNYVNGVYADGSQDGQSPVVFPDTITDWGGGHDYTSPATFSSSTGVMTLPQTFIQRE